MWLLHNKANTCTVPSIGGCMLLSRVVGGTHTPSLLPSLEKKRVIVTCRCCIDYTFLILILFERIIILLFEYIMQFCRNTSSSLSYWNDFILYLFMYCLALYGYNYHFYDVRYNKLDNHIVFEHLNYIILLLLICVLRSVHLIKLRLVSLIACFL